MIIKQVTKRGRILMSPVDNKSLFKHCSNGQSEVTKKKWDSDVEPLLRLHGVSDIYIKIEE